MLPLLPIFKHFSQKSARDEPYLSFSPYPYILFVKIAIDVSHDGFIVKNIRILQFLPLKDMNHISFEIFYRLKLFRMLQ